MAGKKLIEHAARFHNVAHRFASVDTLADIVADREKDPDHQGRYFWPRNIAVYSALVEDREDGTPNVQFFVSLTIDPAFHPLLRGHAGPLSTFRYSPPEYVEFQRSVKAGNGLCVSYADLDNADGLRLTPRGDVSVLEIRVEKLVNFSTDASDYFNPSQRALVLFLYGSPQAHGRMLLKEYHPTTRIILPAPAYLQNHLFDLPVVRGCWVGAVNTDSSVELTDNHDSRNVGFVIGYPAPPSVVLGNLRR